MKAIIILWLFAIIFILPPIVLIHTIREERKKKRAQRNNLELIRDALEAERYEIERELAHLEVKRQNIMDLWEHSTPRQRIVIDDQIFKLDKRIEELKARL